jgi:hypothetical protein
MDIKEEERKWVQQQTSNGAIVAGSIDLTGGRTITRIDQGLYSPGRLSADRHWTWSNFLHRWVPAKVK